MSGDPRTLVRFFCVAKAHSHVEGAAALTIHDHAWAFCPAGGAAAGHTWQDVDGLPFAITMPSTAVAHDRSYRIGAEADPPGQHPDPRPTAPRKPRAAGR